MSNFTLILILAFCFINCRYDKSILDIEGNRYKIFLLNNTLWFSENLKVTKFSNGDPISSIVNDSMWWMTIDPAYCYYNNDKKYFHKYGNLYNWYAVNDDRNICPCGWKVASKQDFDDLCIYYGGISICGSSLKESNHKNSNIHIRDTIVSCFNAKFSGGRDDKFYGEGSFAFYWNFEAYLGTNCNYDNGCAYEHTISNELDFFLSSFATKNRGMSVRCVKKI